MTAETQSNAIEAQRRSARRLFDSSWARAPLRRRTRAAVQTTWVIRLGDDDIESDHRQWIQPEYRTVDAERIANEAKSGDRVLITGHNVRSIVAICEQLLHRGVAVSLDSRKLPALKPIVSRRESGVDWVDLWPRTMGRMPRALSRSLDITVGLLCTLVAAPAVGLLMFGIRTTSPGAAIFRSPRVGRDGSVFALYKLRTMSIGDGADNHHHERKEKYREFMSIRDGSEQKLKVVDTSRVTPIGRFLRKHSLDELPQFWNVVRGELSLVGPRPCIPYEWDLHEDWHRMRFRGRPGLTGLWQVYGRSRVTFEEMVLMDYCYHWRKSVGSDLRIILRTAWVVISGEGGE